MATKLDVLTANTVLLCVEVTAPVAIVVGARRWAAYRRPWYLLAAGVFSFWGGNFAMRVIFERTGDLDPFPSIADLFYYGGYLGMAAGAMVLIRSRSGRRDWATTVDSLIVAGGVGLVIGSFIIGPYARQGSLPLFDRSLSVGYALLDLVLVGIWARLAIGPGARNPAYFFYAGCFSLIVVTDMMVTLQTAGIYTGPLVPIVSALCFVACATGALHPSMGALHKRDDTSVTRLTRRRFAVLCGALAMAPLVLAVKTLTGHEVDPALVVLGACVMAALVLSRMSLLVRANERRARRERILREAGLVLVAATTREEMHEGALSAVLALSGVAGRTRASLATVTGAELRVVASVGEGALDALGRTLELDVPPRPLALHGVPAVDADDDGRGSLLVLPLVIQGAPRGVIVVTSPAPVAPDAEDTLANFASAVALALETAALTEALHRRKNERRFKALIEHSSDMVAVVRRDATITFASPSCARALGSPVGTLVGSCVTAFAHPDDAPALAAAITGASRPGERARDAVAMRLGAGEGTWRWFEVQATDLSADAEVGGVVLNARDVNDRREAEQRLAGSEARFRSLVQNSTDVVAVVDDELVFTYVSPAVGRVLGYDAVALIGRRAYELVHPDDMPAAAESLNVDSYSAGQHRAELRVRSADGSWHTLDVTAADLRHEPSVRGVVLNARDVSDRKELEGELRFQALHDSLTGLANRTLFSDRVEHALKRRSDRGDLVAVLFIDVDDFKTINDSLGHAAGDELLASIAERLRDCVREGDTPARLGGDEFAVLVEDLYSEEDVSALAQRILDDLARPFEVGGRTVTATASIGVAIDAARASSSEVLLRNADAAMYLAKERGKARFDLFEEAMHAVAYERLELKNDMATSLEQGDFTVHYQPVVSIANGVLVGVEALLRWTHPRRGAVRPDVFVPIAEQTGFIVPLGRWVLDRACAQVRAWRDEHPSARVFPVSVNLSVRQLEDPALVDDVRSSLARWSLSPSDLILEITESILMTDTETTTKRLAQLRELGVQLALDDFGVGYSSLAYLHRYPVDVVKIDRSFVDGLGQASTDVAVLESIVALASRRKLRLVAEGVETEEQRQALAALGCDFAQGFFFSRPVPADEVPVGRGELTPTR